jgi:hypothetical protein
MYQISTHFNCEFCQTIFPPRHGITNKAATTETQPIRHKNSTISINIASKHTRLPVNLDNTGLTDNKLNRKSNWLIDSPEQPIEWLPSILWSKWNYRRHPAANLCILYAHMFFCNNNWGLRPRGEYCFERVRASSYDELQLACALL